MGKKKIRKIHLVIVGIIILSFLVGVYFYPKMPDKIASHWDIDGGVDGYMLKIWSLFLMPIISIGIFLFFLLLPKIDPLKKNIDKFRKYFDYFILTLFYSYFIFSC